MLTNSTKLDRRFATAKQHASIEIMKTACSRMDLLISSKIEGVGRDLTASSRLADNATQENRGLFRGFLRQFGAGISTLLRIMLIGMLGMIIILGTFSLGSANTCELSECKWFSLHRLAGPTSVIADDSDHYEATHVYNQPWTGYSASGLRLEYVVSERGDD